LTPVAWPAAFVAVGLRYVLSRAAAQALFRLIRKPTIKSRMALNFATTRPVNKRLGCPHHKHDALATVVGLPQAEHSFAGRMEVSSQSSR
jgi:hypothetical protein